MKFIILSSLFAVALGSSARELQVADDRYHVDSLTATKIDKPELAKFDITALHQEGDSQAYDIKIFKTCPQGDIANVGGGNPEITTYPWLTIDNFAGPTVVTGTDYKTTFDLEVLNLAVGVPDIWTDTSAGATLEEGNAHFCVWFGMKDAAGEYYGFRELKLTAYFKFNGAWECVTFETQAYNPKSQSTTKKIQAELDIDCMPQPLRPGMVACARICPGSNGEDIKIDNVVKLVLKEGKCPDTVAPDKQFVIKDDATKLTNVEEAIDGTKPECMEIKWLLPARFFPQFKKETPDTSTFCLNGSGTFADATAPIRRQLSGRELQESGDADIYDEVGFALDGPDGESSSSVLALGAAAAVAGAALLI